MTTMTVQATQVYQLFIRATPEQIWDAITKPEFTERYFHGTHVETAFEPGGPYDMRLVANGELAVKGTLLESDPPRRLVHTWLALYDAETAAEEPSRVSWEIEPRDGDVCLLTVVHDRLDGAPKTAESVSGAGWMGVLSGLKTLLETGEPLMDHRSASEERA